MDLFALKIDIYCKGRSKKWSNLIIMDAKNIILKKYFENNYNIPEFQRDYVWKNSKLDEIYNELFTAYENDDNLFLGSVYLDGLNIIDGQQRTTFLYILISELYISYFQKQEWINKQISETKDPRDSKIFVETRKHILSFYINFTLKKEEEKLVIYKKFPEDAKDNEIYDRRLKIGGQAKRIRNKNKEQDALTNLKFLNFLLKKVTLTRNIIESMDNMNDVFSSINSKGANLETWDLLKNDIHKFDKKNNYLNFNKIVSHIDDGNKDDVKLNKQFVGFAIVTTVLNMEGKFPKKNDYYKLSKNLLDEEKENYIEKLNTILSKIKIFKNLKVDSENYKTLWIYKIIEKGKFKQIRTLFWWSLTSGHFDKYENIFDFYKKTIIYFLFYVNINDKRANKFEAVFKQFDFFINLEKTNYNFELMFKENEIIDIIKKTNFENLVDEKSEEYGKMSKNNVYLYIGYWLDILNSQTGIQSYTKCFNRTATIEHVYDKSYAKGNKSNEHVHLIGNKIIIYKDANQSLPKIYSKKLDAYNDGKSKLELINSDKTSIDYILNSTFIKDKPEFKNAWTKENIIEKTKLINNIISKKMKNNI